MKISSCCPENQKTGTSSDAGWVDWYNWTKNWQYLYCLKCTHPTTSIYTPGDIYSMCGHSKTSENVHSNILLFHLSFMTEHVCAQGEQERERWAPSTGSIHITSSFFWPSDLLDLGHSHVCLVRSGLAGSGTRATVAMWNPASLGQHVAAAPWRQPAALVSGGKDYNSNKCCQTIGW